VTNLNNFSNFTLQESVRGKEKEFFLMSEWTDAKTVGQNMEIRKSKVLDTMQKDRISIRNEQPQMVPRIRCGFIKTFIYSLQKKTVSQVPPTTLKNLQCKKKVYISCVLFKISKKFKILILVVSFSCSLT
jgi:hypothetical protein